MNNNRNNNNNNNNFPSPQGDYLVLYIENVINTAILLRNRSQRVNPSRDWSPRLIPSCKLYRGPVPATGPCDQSLRLVPSCVATLMRPCRIKATRGGRIVSLGYLGPYNYGNLSTRATLSLHKQSL